MVLVVIANAVSYAVGKPSDGVPFTAFDVLAALRKSPTGDGGAAARG
jgi:hypothetical protein